MRRSSILSLCTLALAAGFGLRQAPSQDSSHAALAGRLEAVEARLAHVEAYLQDQALSSQELGMAIEAALADGFTWGENWRSRETLVAAWKSQVLTALTDVPGVQVIPAVYVDPRVLRRHEIERLRAEKRQREQERREREGDQGGDR